MGDMHADLVKDLETISHRFTDLSGRLTKVAEELRASGSPPDESLIQEMTISRSTFTDLRTRALELAGLLSVSTNQPAEGPGSLRELEALLHSLTEAEGRRAADEEKKLLATSVLDRILGLAHRGASDFQPLTDCQAKADALKQAIGSLTWPDLHPEIEAVVQGRHPLAELLTLVKEGESLDDDLWLLLEQEVANAFGRPLSLAAARGRIVSDRQLSRAGT
ncbi:MAG: hypothetical protein HZB35_00930 [Nitrospirae bacterium]|nr:hypothetical protein [Nitrospirota bacterium]